MFAYVQKIRRCMGDVSCRWVETCMYEFFGTEVADEIMILLQYSIEYSPSLGHPHHLTDDMEMQLRQRGDRMESQPPAGPDTVHIVVNVTHYYCLF